MNKVHISRFMLAKTYQEDKRVTWAEACWKVSHWVKHTSHILMLLDVADKLQTFTIQQLYIKAFELYPSAFGLKLRPEWPDTAHMASHVYGKLGLIKREVITKVSYGRYSISLYGKGLLSWFQHERLI